MPCTLSAVHQCLPQEGNHCSTIYSTLTSPVSALKFATSGVRLVAGFECGQVRIVSTKIIELLIAS